LGGEVNTMVSKDKQQQIMMDARRDKADEYIQERCSHENVWVDDITVKILSKPKQGFEAWQKYLKNNGTANFEMYIHVRCEDCGASQEQWICEAELIDKSMVRWDE